MAAAARYLIEYSQYPLLLIVLRFSVSLATQLDAPIPGCRQKCGGVEITYPFGIGHGCHLPGFEIICEQEIPFIAGSEIQLLEILPGEVRVNSTPFIASYCPLSSKRDDAAKSIVLPKHGPYTFATGSNNLVALGCNVEGVVLYGPGTSTSFCLSSCQYSSKEASKGTCHGNGCCETPIDEVTDSLQVIVQKFDDPYPATYSCKYAFIVEDGRYNYSESDNFSSGVSTISMKLEWAIGEGTCGQAVGTSSYACGTNSACVESRRGAGYLCACSRSDKGNPYLSGIRGCRGNDFPHCQERCGNVTISYPFGIGEGCFSRGFEVTCGNSIPYLADLDVQLYEITQGEVSINSTTFMAMECPGTVELKNFTRVELPQDSPYTISVGSNKFMVVGCDAEGTVTDENSQIEFCRTRCSTRGNAVNGNCTGYGCCQKSLPLLRKSFDLTVSNINSAHFNACSYAFVAEDGSYKFKEDDLLSFRSTADIRMKLEWALGEETCSEAKLSPLYACSRNTTCVESSRGYGYLCSCLDGYQGNPYSSQGCQDIDECSSWNQTICLAGASCRNKPGGYDCICPKGSVIGKLGCHKPSSVAHVIAGCSLNLHIFKLPNAQKTLDDFFFLPLISGVMVVFPLAASISLAAIMAACISWCYWVYRKRKLLKLRANYFLRNGGLLLQQHLCPRKGLTSKHPKIFSAEELKLATENYKSSRILGHGGHGTVYQGTLKDGTVVAVKKSQVVAQDKLDQFINELIILTQINHRNIVQLLGCCLETQVPLLVYEYIPNGTLHQNLHQGPEFPRLPWKDRLRIATEVAEALSYLHSYASMPVFHRDVKSSNILLDQNSTAKLADFGISRFVPIDKDQVSTAVLGTIGYLDPAYFNSGKLTDKSDVYSFGVVLLELLTGKKPIIQDVSQDYCSLVVRFQSHNNSGKLLEILDEEIVKEGAIEQVLAIAEIARSCVSSEGEKRPSMKRVMQEFTYIGKYIPSINEANDAGVHLHREIHSVKCIGFLTGS